MAILKPLKLRSEKVAVKRSIAAENFVAEILVDTKVFHLDEPYSYLVPELFSDQISVGTLVKVPFGRSNTEGIVLRRYETQTTGGLKLIDSPISQLPAVTDFQIELFREVAARYGVPLWDVFHLAIPSFSKSGERQYQNSEEIKASSIKRMNTVTIHNPNTGKTETIGQEAFNRYMSMTNGDVMNWIVPKPEALQNPNDQSPLTREVVTLKQGANIRDEVGNLALRYPDQKILIIAPDEKTLRQLDGLGATSLSGSLNKSERYANYLKANFATSGLFIGLRSSIFVSFSVHDILVVIDETDENMYEKRTPGYNVRDIAFLRSKRQSVVFLSSVHSLEVERVVETGWFVERSVGSYGKRVISEAEESAHGIISEGLKLGSVLVVHANTGYVNSFTCNNCRNLAMCNCGGRLILARNGKATTCSLCAAKKESWVCEYCRNSLPRSVSKGVEKRAEDYGRSFPRTRVLSSTGQNPETEVPTENSLVVVTPGMEPQGEYAALLLMDGDQLFSRTGLRSDEQSELFWGGALTKLVNGGVVYVSLPSAHPITQSIVRNSFTKYHLERISQRASAFLPPIFRMAVVEGKPSETAHLFEYLSNLEGEVDLHILGPIDLPAGISRVVIKFDVNAHSQIVRKLYEYNRIRSLTGQIPLRVRVDPFDLI